MVPFATAVGLLAVGLTLRTAVQVQPKGPPPSKPQADRRTPSPSTVAKAMDGLIGHSLYSCNTNVESTLRKYDPLYFDATDAKGLPIPDADLGKFFPTAGELYGAKLTILGAETDMHPVDDHAQNVMISLNVENPANGASAGVQVQVRAADVTPSRILAGVVSNGGSGFVWYNLRPVRPVELGMPLSDVFCSLGSPDHMNTDARGDDQLVYLGGKLYVYIGHRTNRVTNIQKSF